MDSIHSGHRQRLKERYSQHSLDNFSDIEALELLLTFALPRRDTNPIAHALLDRFGDYRSVLEADAAALEQVPGIGTSAALLIRLVADSNRRYLTAPRKQGQVIRNSREAGALIAPMFAYLTEEAVYVLTLDNRSAVIRCQPVAQGAVNKVDFALRDIVDLALRDKAAGVILAHNHLSGTALPSHADLHSTQQLYRALEALGVQLRDHIIVCDGDFVSLRDSGYFNML